MKKILFLITDLAVGGAQRLIIEQINHIDRREFNPYLATLLPSVTKFSTTEINLPEEKIKFFDFKSFYNFKAWISFISWMKKQKFDILYTNLQFANDVGRIANFFVGIKKTISVEHNVYPDKEFRRFLVDWLLSFRTDKIIVDSKAIEDFIIKRGRISPKKIRINRNAIDLKKNKQAPLDRDNDFIIFSSGAVSKKQKGYEALLDTALELKKTAKKKFKFLVAGYCDTWYGRELKEKAKSMKVDDVVQFLGVRNDIPELLFDADIFFMPSKFEGFPLAILEAVASGLPVVASDAEGITEIGSEGFIIKGDNRGKKFAKAINFLMENKDVRKEFGEKNKRKSTEFSIEKNVERLQNVINEKVYGNN